MTYNVFNGTLNPTQSINLQCSKLFTVTCQVVPLVVHPGESLLSPIVWFYIVLNNVR